ncbi:MAG: VOC family protein [Pseudomonadota bacterium]
MRPRISMVALGVADLDRSRRFYEQGLGLPRIDAPPGVVFFRLDGTWLGLSLRDDLAADAGVPAAGAGHSGVNLVHNVRSEADVDALIAAADAGGGAVVKAPVRAEWGGYHGYFADPDGHLWEVAHNPFLWIGPTDR